jgi:hypothetical protein
MHFSDGVSLLKKIEEKFLYGLIRGQIQQRVANDKSNIIFNQYIVPYLQEHVVDREHIWEQSLLDGKLWMVQESEAIPSPDDENYTLEFQRGAEGYDCSPRRVCELSSVQLLGDRAIVRTSDGNYVYESMNNSEKYLISTLPTCVLRCSLPFRKSTHFDTAMSMVMHTWDPAQYGHWLVEYLPRLLGLSLYEDKTGRSPDIIIPRDPPEWMTESLSLLGYSADRLVEWDYETATVDRLVQPFTSKTRGSLEENEFSPIEHRWLRNQFLEEIGDDVDSREARYYISRQGMSKRYIENFGQCKSVLESYGFEVIQPEKLTFREQVETFAKAGILIGSHSSGLHNQLFTRDATVVEIFPPGVYEPSNPLLAGELGHEYISIMGDEFEDESDKERAIDSSYRLGPTELDSTLDRLTSDNRD